MTRVFPHLREQFFPFKSQNSISAAPLKPPQSQSQNVIDLYNHSRLLSGPCKKCEGDIIMLLLLCKHLYSAKFIWYMIWEWWWSSSEVKEYVSSNKKQIQCKHCECPPSRPTPVIFPPFFLWLSFACVLCVREPRHHSSRASSWAWLQWFSMWHFLCVNIGQTRSQWPHLRIWPWAWTPFLKVWCV